MSIKISKITSSAPNLRVNDTQHCEAMSIGPPGSQKTLVNEIASHEQRGEQRASV